MDYVLSLFSAKSYRAYSAVFPMHLRCALPFSSKIEAKHVSPKVW